MELSLKDTNSAFSDSFFGQVLARLLRRSLRWGLPVTHTLNFVPEKYRAAARATFLSTGKNTLNDSVSNPFYGLIGKGSLASRTTTRSQLLYAYPQFTSLAQNYESSGSSRYDSFQLKVSKRFSCRVSTCSSAYTNAKTIWKTSRLNASDANLIRELCSYDVPQRLVVSGTYELPVGKGRHFFSGSNGPFGKAIEGWQLNWTYTAQGGIPLSVASAESAGRSAKLSSSEQTISEWFDTSAFRARETLELVGTRTLPDVRTAGRNNMDFSVFKDTFLVERLKLQFRAEAFNLFNRAELGDPGMTYGSFVVRIVSFADQLRAPDPARAAIDWWSRVNKRNMT